MAGFFMPEIKWRERERKWGKVVENGVKGSKVGNYAERGFC
jgi:hypothetical protein